VLSKRGFSQEGFFFFGQKLFRFFTAYKFWGRVKF
jgi:hypothetical protein